MKTLTELAKAIQVPYYKIKYLHLSGKLPEPKKVGGIRIYDKKLIRKVKAYFLNQERKA